LRREYMNIQTGTMIGVELEAMLMGPDGMPADTMCVLNGGYKSPTHRFEALTSDMARSSAELITTPCRSPAEIEASLNRCAAQVPEGYSLRFISRMVADACERVHIPLSNKSRVPAMIAALEAEKKGSGQAVYDVGAHNCTQFHIGVDDIYSLDSILLCNLLTNAGPYARKKVSQRYGASVPGHMLIWERIIEPRIPRSRWFGSFGELNRAIESIPKLLTRLGDEWTPAISGKYSSITDEESMGTIWWLARPRHSYSTYEWRPAFPSLPIPYAVELAGEIFTLVNAFREYVDVYPKASIAFDSTNVRRLFAQLSKRTYLIPPQPLSAQRWTEYSMI
jgi:hypothetical protein